MFKTSVTNILLKLVDLHIVIHSFLWCVCVCVCPREDDDINDVASMAGVNLREENAQILTTMVGSVVQSCQDQLFLSPNPVLRRILRAGTRASLRRSSTALLRSTSHIYRFVQTALISVSFLGSS